MSTQPATHTPRRFRGSAPAMVIALAILAASIAVLATIPASPSPRDRPSDPGTELGWQSIASEVAKHTSSLVLPANATPDTSADPELVPPELVAVFDAFDANGDGLLQVGEAASFYAWVSENIHYRYDNENGGSDEASYPVGDGRSGVDYWQSPRETFEEGMGDCEDQSILTIAFYQHWNIPAFLALVNVLNDEAADHAVAVVRAAETQEDLFAAFGPVPYYEFVGREDAPDGLYVIVDNAYSQSFADVSGDIEPGRFEVFRLLPFPELLGAETSMHPILPAP